MRAGVRACRQVLSQIGCVCRASEARRRRTQRTRTQSQDNAYPLNQNGVVHTARAAMRIVPAAIAHQPSHRGKDGEARRVMPIATQNPASATHAFANARLPRSNANRACSGSRPSGARNAAISQPGDKPAA